MKQKKTAFLALSLAALQTLTIFAASVPEQTNASNGSSLIQLENDYWYKVKLPAAIDLKLNQNTQAYDNNYDILVQGQAPGKMFQVESEDFEMNGDNKIMVSSFVGQANNGETNHKYILGLGAGDQPALTEEWQSINSLITRSISGVKHGNYNGTANFKYRLVDPAETIVSDIKLDDNKITMGVDGTHPIKAMYNGENIVNKINWVSENENIATVSENGEVVVGPEAKPGDMVTIKGEITDVNSFKKSSFLDVLKTPFGPIVAHAKEKNNAAVSLVVKIAELNLTNDKNEKISEISVPADESYNIKGNVISAENDTIDWSVSDKNITMVKKGNDVSFKIPKTYAAGKTFTVTAKCGDVRKTINVTSKKAIYVTKTGKFNDLDYVIQDRNDDGVGETLVLRGEQSSKDIYKRTNVSNPELQKICDKNITDIVLDNPTFTYCHYLFYNLNVKSITGRANTSQVENMSFMFQRCMATYIDVSSFDTSNVKTMSSMFSGCTNLTTLDVSGFNTSNVTNMGSMFAACYNLASLDVSGFDTHSLYSPTSSPLDSMFYACRSLEHIDVSNFDTSNVKSFTNVFSDCRKLTSIDLSGWDTTKARSGINHAMFGGCTNLKIIKAPKAIKQSLLLNGTWVDSDGNRYTKITKPGITLTKQ